MPRISVSEMEFDIDNHWKFSRATCTGVTKNERWRGPHEEKVVGLMLCGIKPAAMVDYDHPDYDALSRLAKNGTIAKTKIRYKRVNNRLYVGVAFTQNNQVWRANKLAKIYKRVDETDEMRLIDHARVGILLGYSNKEIRYFLNDISDRPQ